MSDIYKEILIKTKDGEEHQISPVLTLSIDNGITGLFSGSIHEFKGEDLMSIEVYDYDGDEYKIINRREDLQREEILALKEQLKKSKQDYKDLYILTSGSSEEEELERICTEKFLRFRIQYTHLEFGVEMTIFQIAKYKSLSHQKCNPEDTIYAYRFTAPFKSGCISKALEKLKEGVKT